MQERGVGREARGRYHEESVKMEGARERGWIEKERDAEKMKKRERGGEHSSVCLDGGP